MRLWKLLGVAGLAGVAAGGAVLARSERQRRAYTPDDVRARLHARAAEAPEQQPAPATPAQLIGGRRHRLAAEIRRRRARKASAGWDLDGEYFG